MTPTPISDALIEKAEGIIPQRVPEMAKDKLREFERELAASTSYAGKLREALEFYADPTTYHGMVARFDRPTGGFDEDFGPNDEYDYPKPGKLARAALAAGPTNRIVHDEKRGPRSDASSASSGPAGGNEANGGCETSARDKPGETGTSVNEIGPEVEGWKLVPVEPSEDMRVQGARAVSNNAMMREVWRSMIDAAPAFPGAEGWSQQMIAFLHGHGFKHHVEGHAIGPETRMRSLLKSARVELDPPRRGETGALCYQIDKALGGTPEGCTPAPSPATGSVGVYPTAEAWLIRYADAEVEDEVFTGPGAEAAARARFDVARLNWTAWLFRSVAATVPDDHNDPYQLNPTGEARAKLIQALRSYSQADEDGIFVKVSRQACDGAAAILEGHATGLAEDWIAMADRKPSDTKGGTEFLIASSTGYVTTLEWDGNAWKGIDARENDGYWNKFVTHWKPLPKAPASLPAQGTTKGDA